MTPDQWFEALRAALPADALPLDDDLTAALLDLARVGARASERWVAPVSTFLAGVALADTAPASRAATLRRLVATLEANASVPE